MDTKVIDGRKVADTMAAALAERVSRLPCKPGLAVIIVGDNPASRVYVRAKHQKATAAGLTSLNIDLPTETTEADLLAEIAALNANPEVDGILVQLPLPAHIRPDAVFSAIAPEKDVDGFHPVNVGRLSNTETGFLPCTPQGVLRLIREANVSLEGAQVLVIGTGAIVGRPTALLLSKALATVTMAHKATRDLPEECARADIVIAAAGCPNLVRRDHLKRGAVVIDVGINRLADRTLVGDVAFEECLGWVSAITPVPGGVGPMTIAYLLENTVMAAERRRS